MMKPLMLKVDLSRKSYETEVIPAEVLRKYIGGRGVGCYYLYKLLAAGTDPLGKDNHLIFTAGPASGTGMFFSSKTCLTTKSPQTGLYLRTVTSGNLSEQMKQAGCWAIDISGTASSPTCIEITDQDVKFIDASALWGMEVAGAQKAMLSGRPEDDVATVGIGPAGEKLVAYAGVFTDGALYRCCGRGGAGAVMGSKKLKGFTVAGSGKVEVIDKEGLNAVNRDAQGRG